MPKFVISWTLTQWSRLQIMANQHIQMFQIKRIIDLRLAGKSKRNTAELLGLSRNTVESYLQRLFAHNSELEFFREWTEADLFALLMKPIANPNPPYPDLYKLFPDYAKELTRTGVSRYTLWMEYRIIYPNGLQYRQFCTHFARWSDSQKITMHLEHKAGDKLFVDFAGDRLYYFDKQTGEQIYVEFFVAILPCSQYTFATCVKSQKKEDFILGLKRTLTYLGGSPQAIVPDNLKTAVTKADRYEPEINETLAGFASHYSSCIFPARSRKPRDKALVESAVNILYGRIYAPLRNRIFYSIEELNDAVAPLLEAHNLLVMKEKGYCRKERFMEVEQSFLKPLPSEHYQTKSICFSKVQKNGHATLKEDKHYYSVPHTLIGKTVKFIYSESTVEIYVDCTRVAYHERFRAKSKYTTAKEHLLKKHQLPSDWSPEYFQSWAGNIGTDTRLAIDEILCKTPYVEQAYRSCLAVLCLAKKYSKPRLEAACGRALLYNHVSGRLVKTILDNELDMLVLEEERVHHLNHHGQMSLLIATHDNIRGPAAYQ